MDLQGYNTLKDLLDEEQFSIYNALEYPFSIQVLRSALDKRLETKPDYEVWVPISYYKLTRQMRSLATTARLEPHKFFISNKGNVLNLRYTEPLKTKIYYPEELYPIFGYSSAPGKYESIMVHRALACLFVPVTINDHPRNLHVNHKNGDKWDFELSNLEWTTPGGNNQHAIDTGLRKGVSGWDNNRSKPVKGTVLIGPYTGLEFVICGEKEAKEYGFNMQGISACCLGKWEKYRNCKWVHASEDDYRFLSNGLPDEVLTTIDLLIRKPKSHILATVKKTNDQFVIERGYPELLELGFIPSSVTDVINGRRKSHKGHYFERIENDQLQTSPRG